MSIDRFFIIANRSKDKGQELSVTIRDYLEAHGKTCRIVYSEEERQELRAELNSSTDCILVLGGDGTVLEAAHLSAGTDTPILGINIGHLGYLAEVPGHRWVYALQRVLEGSFEIESRMMLAASVSDEYGDPYPDAGGHALNDVVITRNRGLQVLDFNVFIDGQLLKRFHADGVIVSTATGSTAYNMSAGGPIVEPKARLILLTPISPHSFNNRSVVLSADDRIVIEMIPPRNGDPMSAECDFDGNQNIDLKCGDRISISRSEGVTRLIRLDRGSFLETLHKKFTS